MQDLYETSDLGIASALCCLGFQVVRLNRENPRRVIFFIEGDFERIEAIILQYWDGTLRISPVALFAQQKILKSRIYEGRP